MQRIDMAFAALSVFAALCVASYIWIFLYRPALFQFTQLKTLVWYKRIPGNIYFVFAMLGLGFMFYRSIEAVLWWMPRTVMFADRPLPEIIAISIGFGGAGLVVSKLEEIAKERSSE